MTWDAMPWIVGHKPAKEPWTFPVNHPKCARCGHVIDVDPEYCWYCTADLCANCKDMAGHCGHPEAEKIMRVADGR